MTNQALVADTGDLTIHLSGVPDCCPRVPDRQYGVCVGTGLEFLDEYVRREYEVCRCLATLANSA